MANPSAADDNKPQSNPFSMTNPDNTRRRPDGSPSVRFTFQLFFGILVALAVAELLLALWSARLGRVAAAAQSQRYASYLLVDELRQSSDDLTRMARAYVVTADPMYEQFYNDILDIRHGGLARPPGYSGVYWDFMVAMRGRPQLQGQGVPPAERMRRLGFAQAELGKLEEALRQSDALMVLERTGMFAVQGRFRDAQGRFTVAGPPDVTKGRALLHGPEYLAAKARAMKPLAELLVMLDRRTGDEAVALARRGHRVANIQVGLAVVVLAGLLVGFFLLHRRLLHPLEALRQGAQLVEDLRRKGKEAQDVNLELEQRLEERTAELDAARQALHQASEERLRFETRLKAQEEELRAAHDAVASARQENAAASRNAEAALEETRTSREEAALVKQEAEAVRQEVQTIKREIEAARQEADRIRNERDSARQEGDAVRTECDLIRQEMDALRAERDSARQEAEAALRLAQVSPPQVGGQAPTPAVGDPSPLASGLDQDAIPSNPVEAKAEPDLSPPVEASPAPVEAAAPVTPKKPRQRKRGGSGKAVERAWQQGELLAPDPAQSAEPATEPASSGVTDVSTGSDQFESSAMPDQPEQADQADQLQQQDWSERAEPVGAAEPVEPAEAVEANEPAAPPEAEPMPEVGDSFEEVEGVDIAEGLKRAGGNQELYRQLLHRFRDTQVRAADQIRDALGHGNIDLAQRLARTLKRLSGDIGAREVRGAAKEVDVCLRRRDPAGAESALPSLSAALDRAVSGIIRMG